jgi:hypothetical protein
MRSQLRHQVELLEHEADLRAQLADVAVDAAALLHAAAVDLDQRIGAAIGRHQAGHVPQQGGFAGARGADQRHHLAAVHGQVDVAQRMPAVGEVLVQLVDAQDTGHLGFQSRLDK